MDARIVSTIAAALVIVTAGCGGGAAPQHDPAARTTDRAAGGPDIVVVMTDDQRVESRRQGMPRTTRWMRERGTTFTDSIVTTPLCCPSRASFLTGQYGHNHGILINEPGYPDLVDRRNVLPVWMRRAGYQTALVGKYLHGYGDDDASTARPAPGWDEWRVMLRGFAYRDFQLGINGEVRDFGGDAYLTDELTAQAVKVITDHDASGSPEPLFMWVTYWAPHEDRRTEHRRCGGTAIPAGRDQHLLSRVQLPGGDAARLEDVSDKPRPIASRDPVDRRTAERLRVDYACQVASLRAVDRGIGRIRAALADAGRLGDTVFIVTSDNGFINGEHRIRSGKGVPYEESIRVPLAAAGPGIVAGAIRDELVANIDLAPTILELAGARPCRRGGDCRPLDGRSLAGLLRGGGGTAFAGRELVVESEDGKPCGYRGLRSEHLLYVEYDEGAGPACRPAERELYDFRLDPEQNDNLLAAGGGLGRDARRLAARLSRRLGELARCRGGDCREPAPGAAARP